jgi:hypothetical protein
MPSPALIACLFSTKEFKVPVSMVYLISLFPFKVKVIFSPDSNAVVPSGVLMVPSLVT